MKLYFCSKIALSEPTMALQLAGDQKCEKDAKESLVKVKKVNK